MGLSGMGVVGFGMGRVGVGLGRSGRGVYRCREYGFKGRCF